jgi:hypothetical protein
VAGDAGREGGGPDLSDHEALDGVPKPPMANLMTNDGQ